MRQRFLNAMGRRLDPLTRLRRFRVKERHQSTVAPLRVLLLLDVACAGPSPRNSKSYKTQPRDLSGGVSTLSETDDSTLRVLTKLRPY